MKENDDYDDDVVVVVVVVAAAAAAVGFVEDVDVNVDDDVDDDVDVVVCSKEIGRESQNDLFWLPTLLTPVLSSASSFLPFVFLFVIHLVFP